MTRLTIQSKVDPAAITANVKIIFICNDVNKLFVREKKMSIVDQHTDESYHDVGNGVYLNCEYHDNVWEGKTTEAKREAARKFFLKLSPYGPGNPNEDERKLLNEIHHSSTVYCGGKNYIIQSVVYEKCPNRPRKFKSPFHYHSIGSSAHCFLKGKSMGGGGGGGAAPAALASPVPSPVPPAIYPLAPSPPPPSSRSRRHKHRHRRFGSSHDSSSDSEPRPITSDKLQPITSLQQTLPQSSQPLPLPQTLSPQIQPLPQTLPLNGPPQTQPDINSPLPDITPSFELKNHTLPPISATIPEHAKQQDQPLTDADFKEGWSELLKSIQSYIADQVYTPLRMYYDTKIKDRAGDATQDDYNQVLACVKSLELDIRKWIELQKQALLPLVQHQTKAFFYEERERLFTEFKSRWALPISNCTQTSTGQLKHLVKTPQRQIKPPLDISERQSQIMKIMDLRKDSRTCGEEQVQVYDAAIDKLLHNLQSEVPFETLLDQMKPVTDIEPYLKQAWTVLKQTYDEKAFSAQVDDALDVLYTDLPWKASHHELYELVVSMDRSFDASNVWMLLCCIPNLHGMTLSFMEHFVIFWGNVMLHIKLHWRNT